MLERHGVERLPGAHCYGFLAGNAAWDAMQEEEPATFYLTDFLARHFDALVWRPLWLDSHPELLGRSSATTGGSSTWRRPTTPTCGARAEAAADVLGLAFELRRTGYGDLRPSLVQFVGRRRRVPELTVISVAGHSRRR